MIDLDYAALRAAPVAREPFAHVIVPWFLAAAALPAVLADLPPIGKGGSFPAASLRLGPEARSLVQALQGPVLRDVIATRFGLDLADAPTMLTVRGQTRAKDGRIHCDSAAKRVTLLLYLNPDSRAWAGHEGCLRLLRGPGDLEDFAVEVPPVNATLLAFPNGPTCWHGHKPFVGARTSMQLNYMTTDAAARSELRRHRLSAWLKRLTGV
jgi:hypothetical protein